MSQITRRYIERVLQRYGHLYGRDTMQLGPYTLENRKVHQAGLHVWRWEVTRGGGHIGLFKDLEDAILACWNDDPTIQIPGDIK